MEMGELRDIEGNPVDMPMAAIYNMLVRNYQNIHELEIYDAKLADTSKLAKIVDDFMLNADKTQPVDINNTTRKLYKPNKEGLWSLNGNSGSGTLL